MLRSGYEIPSGTVSPISVRLRRALLLLLLVLTLGGSAAKLADVERFLHLVSGTAAKLSPDVQKCLLAALADFRAVQAGKSPVNATLDANRPLPADGGTTYWSGPGYRLSVIKSLARVGGIDGYMYGPVLEFLVPLSVGNDVPISSVSFYSADELRTLLSAR